MVRPLRHQRPRHDERAVLVRRLRRLLQLDEAQEERARGLPLEMLRSLVEAETPRS